MLVVLVVRAALITKIFEREAFSQTLGLASKFQG